MKPADFAQNTPKISIEQYFVGERLGQGVFFDRFGRVQLSFTAALKGRIENGALILDEVLTYSSGEKLNRTYTIKKKRDNLYSLECPDLVGPATIEQSGNSLQWKYRLKQNIKGSVWTLTFNDWMFLQPDGETILNRAWASKFGIGLGEVVMTVR